MKIAIANHGVFPDVIGGMERHTFNLAKHLKEAGHEVHLLVPEPNKGTSYPFPIHHLPWPKNCHFLKGNLIFSRHVGHWIDDHQPDLAFGQGFNLWGYLKRKSIPCVFHPHGLEMYGNHLSLKETIKAWPMRALVRYHAKHSHCTISLGGDLTRILKKRARVPSSKIIEIPNAIDHQVIAEKTPKKEGASFLLVARLAFNKGIDFLPSILEQTKDLPFKLTIVGNGPFRPQVEVLEKKYPHVHYRPTLNDSELKQAYEETECLLFTSRFEGMPTVILEAMAQGCSIVATRIGAVEVMVDENSGILAEPTPRSIANSIREFLALSPEKRLQMGEIGRNRVQNRFTWKAVTPRYEELFSRLI